jgi:hypothetical protein
MSRRFHVKHTEISKAQWAKIQKAAKRIHTRALRRERWRETIKRLREIGIIDNNGRDQEV